MERAARRLVLEIEEGVGPEFRHTAAVDPSLRRIPVAGRGEILAPRFRRSTCYLLAALTTLQRIDVSPKPFGPSGSR